MDQQIETSNFNIEGFGYNISNVPQSLRFVWGKNDE